MVQLSLATPSQATQSCSRAMYLSLAHHLTLLTCSRLPKCHCHPTTHTLPIQQGYPLALNPSSLHCEYGGFKARSLPGYVTVSPEDEVAMT